MKLCNLAIVLCRASATAPALTNARGATAQNGSPQSVLPVDLTGLGLPGCTQSVGPEAISTGCHDGRERPRPVDSGPPTGSGSTPSRRPSPANTIGGEVSAAGRFRIRVW
jgi:hypothetical protein